MAHLHTGMLIVHKIYDIETDKIVFAIIDDFFKRMKFILLHIRVFYQFNEPNPFFSGFLLKMK